MLDYFKSKKAKKETAEKTPIHDDEEAPILNDEDEAFLHQLALEAEGTPPPLPERRPALPPRAKPQDLPITGEAEGNNAQLVLLDVAKNVPVPSAPDTPNEPETITNYEVEEPEEIADLREEKLAGKPHKKHNKWSFLRRDSRDVKKRSQKDTAADLMSAAEGLRAPDAQPNEEGQVSDKEAQKEEEEMTEVLEQLNLAAVDNRVFSMSKESKELLHK